MAILLFLSTPSARRATIWFKIVESDFLYFYPRPPRGGRRADFYLEVLTVLFLSTPSARRATAPESSRAQRPDISIHALREEGDVLCLRWSVRHSNFYPRPPRGGRPTAPGRPFGKISFLSTPSARRATAATLTLRAQIENFYPRPPRGGRHFQRTPPAAHWTFLSTPSARRATPSGLFYRGKFLFLSTPSARRATRGHPHTQGTDREFLSTPSARRATRPPSHSRHR